VEIGKWKVDSQHIGIQLSVGADLQSVTTISFMYRVQVRRTELPCVPDTNFFSSGGSRITRTDKGYRYSDGGDLVEYKSESTIVRIDSFV